MVRCATKNLEYYVDGHPAFVNEIKERFEDNGLSGVVEVSGNTINMTIDFSDKLKDIELTETLITSIDKSFKQTFKQMSGSISDYISDIQKKTDTEDVKFKVTVTAKRIVLSKYTFAHKL